MDVAINILPAQRHSRSTPRPLRRWIRAQLSSEIGIRALPTVAVYRDSIRVFFQAGALPKPALADLIAQVRGLDMEQVRAELDNHQHEPGHVHA